MAGLMIELDDAGMVPMVSDQTRRNLRRAAELIGKADALLITAGAGMSVDVAQSAGVLRAAA